MEILIFEIIAISFLLGFPGQQKAKLSELSKFGRPVSISVVLLSLQVTSDCFQLSIFYCSESGRAYISRTLGCHYSICIQMTGI